MRDQCEVAMTAPSRMLMVLVVGAALSESSVMVAANRQGRNSEVVFVGAQHTLSFLHPGFSPGHLRALLSKIDPVAVLIEQFADFHSEVKIPTFPQEVYAAVTW